MYYAVVKGVQIMTITEKRCNALSLAIEALESGNINDEEVSNACDILLDMLNKERAKLRKLKSKRK